MYSIIAVCILFVATVDETLAGGPPQVDDLPDINATEGNDVLFPFKETYDANMYKVQSCQFGVHVSSSNKPESPVLLEVNVNSTGSYIVSQEDARVSWMGNVHTNLTFKIANVKQSDAKTYQIWCQFTGASGYGKALLRVEAAPTTMPTTAHHESSTSGNTTKASKCSQATIMEWLLVVTCVMMALFNL